MAEISIALTFKNERIFRLNGVRILFFILNIKASKIEDYLPSVFFHEDKEFINSNEIGSIFNTYCAILSWTSLTNEHDCDLYIDRSFSRLKKEKKIRSKISPLNFIHTNENNIRRLIITLNKACGAGILEIT